MQTREVTLVKVNHFCVDCEENDPVDIKCGGPKYIGYDFFVDYDTNTDEITALIKKELKKNGQPLLDIQICEKEVYIQNLFSPGKIRECIKQGYN